MPNANKVQVEALGGSEIYSTAIESGNTVYLSGVIGVDKDGQLVEGDIKDRTTAALERTGDRLAALGLDLSDVVSCQIWLSNYRQDFVPMNEAYVKAFKGYEPLPVRTCVGVAVLPKDTDIEITVIAAKRS